MSNVRAILALNDLLIANGCTGSADRLQIIEVMHKQPEVYGFSPLDEDTRDFYSHAGLVQVVLNSEDTMDWLRADRKIMAIKALRDIAKEVTGTSTLLKAAKDAVEDDRVVGAIAIERLRAKLTAGN